MTEPTTAELLAAVRSAILDLASGTRIKSYSINGHTVIKADITLPELRAIESSLVAQQAAQTPAGRRAYVEFGRPT